MQHIEESEKILNTIFTLLNQSNCKYALIHCSLEIKELLEGDIDIVLDKHPDEIILPIIVALEEQGKIRLIQNLHYEVAHGHYYILQVIEGKNTYIHLDCLWDEYGFNRYHLTTNELLQNTEGSGYFVKTSPIIETLYLLIKRSIKGDIDSNRLNYLQTSIASHSKELEPLVSEWFGSNGSQISTELMSYTKPDDAKQLLISSRAILERRFKKKHLFRFIAAAVLTKVRQFKRFVKPTGLFVVILGPDGCGKSTITDSLPIELHRAYRNIWQFHWRPNFLPKLGRNNTANSKGSEQGIAPPSTSKYKGVISLIRFIYYWLDFVVGYWLKIYPKKAQTTLVIGERYFPDVLVNPARYGFDVPIWIMRFAAKFVPQADVVILLEDDPVAINARKDELSVEAITELLAKYNNELSHWKNPVVVNTAKGIKDVVEQVKDIILSETSRQTANRI